MILQLLAEAQLEANLTNKILALMAKLNAATFGEHLTGFIMVKCKCHFALIGKAGVKHGTCMLTDLTAFC